MTLFYLIFWTNYFNYFIRVNIVHFLFDQMQYMARDWQMSEHLETLLTYLIHKEEEKVQESLHKLETIILSHLKSPFTVYDPAHGEIQLEQYLLIPVYSLDVMPVVDFIDYVQKVKDLVPDSLPDLNLPSLDVQILPPFTGTVHYKVLR